MERPKASPITHQRKTAKYRIVTDNYCGFEVQKRFLFLFWKQVTGIAVGINTFHSIEECEKFIMSLENSKKTFKPKVVKEVFL